jgi:hypothetical protein
MLTNWQVISWTPIEGKPCFRGFFDLETDRGMFIYGLRLFEDEEKGTKWIGFPSREYQDAEGNTQYAPIIAFNDRICLADFRKHALAALEWFQVFGTTPRQPEKDAVTCPTCNSDKVYSSLMLSKKCRSCGNEWPTFPTPVNSASKIVSSESSDPTETPQPKKRRGGKVRAAEA